MTTELTFFWAKVPFRLIFWFYLGYRNFRLEDQQKTSLKHQERETSLNHQTSFGL